MQYDLLLRFTAFFGFSFDPFWRGFPSGQANDRLSIRNENGLYAFVVSPALSWAYKPCLIYPGRSMKKAWWGVVNNLLLEQSLPVICKASNLHSIPLPHFAPIFQPQHPSTDPECLKSWSDSISSRELSSSEWNQFSACLAVSLALNH